VSQRALTGRPPFDRLDATTLSAGLWVAVLTAVLAVTVACRPLCAPRPRHPVDVLFTAERRLFVAVAGLATVGYFDYTYRLPRTTLLLAGGLLAVALPAWFGLVLRRPRDGSRRAVVVGDDPERMAEAAAAADTPLAGLVAPPRVRRAVATTGETETSPERAGTPVVADGSGVETVRDYTALADLEHLGGLARLETALLSADADTAILAFAEPDRGDFFGTLSVCLDHGVSATVHADHADHVLTGDAAGDGPLVATDLDPWSPTARLLKRAFDVCFAVLGLVALAPLMAVVAVAVRRDGGPALYSQERTTEFGDTVTVWKFRTMRPGGERARPCADADNDRITRIGRLLRRTHVDELPQLWTVLSGEMSAVGPRAAWVEEETAIVDGARQWRKRWFVKPGLTGLAQVNGVDSTDPEAKLRYDVAYIRRQSPWLDLRIVARQLWMVLVDARTLFE
jgi:lipopolysaccharide/colanic/teichoic acid biosynthesis glycosyltransferase